MGPIRTSRRRAMRVYHEHMTWVGKSLLRSRRVAFSQSSPQGSSPSPDTSPLRVSGHDKKPTPVDKYIRERPDCTAFLRKLSTGHFRRRTHRESPCRGPQHSGLWRSCRGSPGGDDVHLSCGTLRRIVSGRVIHLSRPRGRGDHLSQRVAPTALDVQHVAHLDAVDTVHR